MLWGGNMPAVAHKRAGDQRAGAEGTRQWKMTGGRKKANCVGSCRQSQRGGWWGMTSVPKSVRKWGKWNLAKGKVEPWRNCNRNSENHNSRAELILLGCSKQRQRAWTFALLHWPVSHWLKAASGKGVQPWVRLLPLAKGNCWKETHLYAISSLYSQQLGELVSFFWS